MEGIYGDNLLTLAATWSVSANKVIMGVYEEFKKNIPMSIPDVGPTVATGRCLCVECFIITRSVMGPRLLFIKEGGCFRNSYSLAELFISIMES
jgi:hypothetical protein